MRTSQLIAKPLTAEQDDVCTCVTNQKMPSYVYIHNGQHIVLRMVSLMKSVVNGF